MIDRPLDLNTLTRLFDPPAPGFLTAEQQGKPMDLRAPVLTRDYAAGDSNSQYWLLRDIAIDSGQAVPDLKNNVFSAVFSFDA
jgi:hypothetical protein